MASDDLCEPPFSNSSLYPGLEPVHDNIDFHWSDYTVPFYWTGHPDVITNTLPSAFTQSTYGLNPSSFIDPNSYYPPLQMAHTTTPFYSESIPSHPSSHVTPPGVSTPGFFTSYPSESNISPPGIRQVNPPSSAQSLSISNTLLSLREPGHDVGSTTQSVYLPEYDFLPLLGDIGPGLWAGPEAFDQEFHQELTSSRNLVAAAPSSSTPTPTTTLRKTGAVKPHCLRPPVEEVRINRGEISTDNQVVDKYHSPTSSAAGRKRKRVPNPSKVADRPPKRRNRVKDRCTLDIQKEARINNTTSADRSILCPSRSPHVITPSTTAEVQRLEPTEDNHDTRQMNAGEFFRNASNFIIKDSTMYLPNNHSNDAALQWLKEHAMRGAEHDSADRDPPPRCHPGTRTTITRNIQDWLENSGRERNLLWLRGTAGVGKSAIIQTVAESLSETGHLGASLFFSRPNGRSNPRQVLPTLAYQFAIQDPSYREYITQFVLTNPESLDKAMNEQFRVLIIEPFVRKGIRSGKAAWAVTLDGLDECGEDTNRRRHSSDTQREIVRLISSFVRQYPTAPLIWIIASRPEVHLKAVFSEPDVVPSFWEEDVPVDSTEACEDVEKFLHKEFTEIRQKYPEHIPDSPWPPHKQFLKIAHAALGLFIFAEVVVRFIGDPEVGNPIAQLECLLFAISKMRSQNQGNPLANLDKVYLTILSKIPPSTLPITKRLLGFLIHLNHTKTIHVEQWNFYHLCQILGISKDTGITTLRHIHSVLYIPKNLGKTRPWFYHASFRDFLEDKSRSHEYFVDKQLFTTDLFFQSLVRVAQARFSSDPDSSLSHLSDESGSDDLISQFVWDVFQGDFSLNGVLLPNYGIFRWLGPLPDVHLQSLLESLNALKVFKYGGYGLHREFEEGNERELSRRGFLSYTTLGSLGINWGTVSMSISELGDCQHIQVDTTLGIQTEDCPYVQRSRRLFKAAASDTKVRIWGHRKSGCRVAIVELLGRNFWEHYAITGIPLVTI